MEDISVLAESRDGQGASGMRVPPSHGLRLDLEAVGYGLLLIGATLTRFYDLGARVMSHDESLHAYYSWLLYRGGGYQHTPLMHGPLQFHLIALSDFLFGDSDATARVPAALSGVLAVGMMVHFRKWLGRMGALVAAGLLLLSPYMLYYSRYARNEAFVVVEALLMFLAVFRYTETRERKWLWVLAGSLALHAITKETFFIYSAQLLVFGAGFLTWQLLSQRWESNRLKGGFLAGCAMAALGSGTALMVYFRERVPQAVARGETGSPLDPVTAVTTSGGLSPAIGIGAFVAVIGVFLVVMSTLLARRRGIQTDLPWLDVVVLVGTLTLPLMGALPASMLGWDPLNYTDPAQIVRTGIVVAILCAVAVGIGLAWKRKTWLVAAGIFYIPFTVFQTTLFTNPVGLFTGLVGSLGYWLVQHGVERGSQPAYYYAFVQLPIYEFLPVAGSVAAAGYALAAWRRRRPRAADVGEEGPFGASRKFPAPLFLGYWAVTSLGAYSFAGERMPWLTVHITLPMILLSGWLIGKWLSRVDWASAMDRTSWLVLALITVAGLGTVQGLAFLLGSPAPLLGMGEAEINATVGVVVGFGMGAACLLLAIVAGRGRTARGLLQSGGLVVLGALLILTGRAALRAAFPNRDSAREFLVYAHSAPGVKQVMAQIEELSFRLTGGRALDLAYDQDVAWPFTWYLRDYTNAVYVADVPTEDLLKRPVVLAGDDYWPLTDRILGKGYLSSETIRMWWPMQDYFGLDASRILRALGSAESRAALWDIWLNRDFTGYGRLTETSYDPTRWYPSERMKLYVRKDIAAQLWDCGMVAGGAEMGYGIREVLPRRVAGR